jgi:AraC family transcriptional regulator
MATEQTTVGTSGAVSAWPVGAGEESLLDSTTSPWRGVKMEQYLTGSSVCPESPVGNYLAALCLNGSCDTEYSLTPDKVLKVPYRSGALFATGPRTIPARRSTGDAEFLVLEIAPNFASLATDELQIHETVEVEPLWGAKDERLRYIMLTLRNELLAGCPSGPMFADYMALSFATALITSNSSHASAAAGDKSGLSPASVRQITAFILDNLSGDLSLAAMANHLQMGPCHFGRAFKASTGHSPHQFVLRRRVERALRMLKETTTNIADMAYELGFCSQGHFTTVFGKVVGVSPDKYRKEVGAAERLGLCGDTV